MKRLDAFLSAAGVGSRSVLREKIRRGEVTVDGIAVFDPGRHIAGTEEVLVCGQPVAGNFVYLMMNKPLGYVCATSGDANCVTQLVPERFRRRGLFPVGRLDKDTTGLLILTDDGMFGHGITSPKKHLKKIYIATLRDPVDERTVQMFAAGLVLRDGLRTQPANLRILAPNAAEITLYEGKYHQVRRMFAACGNFVQTLKRIGIGQVGLDPALAAGAVRPLTDAEKKMLEKA